MGTGGAEPPAVTQGGAESMRDPSMRSSVSSGDWTHLDEVDPPVDPGFDFSVYDHAFLAAERDAREQLAAGEPPPPGLEPDDLRAMADAILAQARKPGVAA